jgi:hypothetical protein
MKEAIIIFLVVFWLSFPFAMMYFSVNNNYIDITEEMTNSIENTQQITVLNSLTVWVSYIKIYFKFMFLIIPDVPLILRLFFHIFQLSSLFAIILVIRGN